MQGPPREMYRFEIYWQRREKRAGARRASAHTAISILQPQLKINGIADITEAGHSFTVFNFDSFQTRFNSAPITVHFS